MSYPGLKKPPPAVGTVVNGFKYMGGDPRSQDPNVWAPLHGDDYLNSLPIDPDKRAVIQSIANYELPPGSGRGGIGSPEVQQLLGFVKQYDPTFDAKNYKVRQDMLHEVNQGTLSGQLKNLTNVSLHARDLQDAYDQMNLSPSPAVNFVQNALARRLGSYGGKDMGDRQRQIGRVNDAINFLAPEAGRLGMGSAPNEADIQAVRSQFNEDTTPLMAEGGLTDIAHKIAQRLLGIQDQWKRAFGNIKPKQPLINKEAAIALHDLIGRYQVRGADDLDWNVLTAGGWSPAQARAIRGAGSRPAVTGTTKPNLVRYDSKGNRIP